jgi:hypothetical protein
VSNEQYIPRARDAVVAYFGRNTAGNLRVHCITCCDEHPLTDPRKVYGDLDQPGPLTHGRGSYGSDDTCDQCEVCWTSLLKLSQMCQAEHDEQQARWSKGPITHLVEYGVTAAPRCRIY